MLINVTQCWESSILFAAREGWVDAKMPSPRNAVNLIVLAKTVQVIVRRGAL